MDYSKDFELEYYEKYYGDAKAVVALIENCPECSSKMVLNHKTDHFSLIVEEVSECLACEYTSKRILHQVC